VDRKAGHDAAERTQVRQRLVEVVVDDPDAGVTLETAAVGGWRTKFNPSVLYNSCCIIEVLD
jgi:hypothetical protein